jgi:hypothetical protein
MPNAARFISQEKSSIIPAFAGTMAPSTLMGSGLILDSTGSTILSLSANPDLRIRFQSGQTRGLTLTNAFTGNLTWR